MNIGQRLEQLERSIPVKLPLTLEEATKWYLMFAERNGCGYATEQREYTPDDWVWFEANEENFVKTTKGLTR